jgi:hypothetical protein
MISQQDRVVAAERRPAVRKAYIETVAVVAVVLSLIAFYAWTVKTTLVYWPAVSGAQGDYYNLLSHGFLDGETSMKVAVPEALINSEDPYDPEKRPRGVGLHDATYYKGKYYLYFGAAPAVVLFVPFRLLTGHDLPASYANLIFVSVGLIAASTLWMSLRRRYFPQSGLVVALIGVLAIGVCGMTMSVLRRPSIWELPISAGYAAAMLSWLFLYKGLHSRSRAGWWALSGLSLGLAVGSRPVYIVGSVIFVLLPLWLWWRGRGAGRGFTWPSRSWWTNTLTLGGVFSAVVIGLLAYNYARFGRIGEFGLSYQLTGINHAKTTFFSTSYMPFNGYIYYLAPAHLGRYFPFIQLIRPPSMPEGYYGFEYPYGLITNMPLNALALLWPLAVFGRVGQQRTVLLGFLLCCFVFCIGMCVTLAGFCTGAQRYMVDFAPSITFLAAVGLLAVERWFQHVAAVWRAVFKAGLGAVAGASVLFGVMASFQLHGLLRVMSPAAYAKVAYWFNYPSHIWERLTGFQHGPLQLTLRFPKGKAGQLEPLVSTGWEFFSDHFFVHYLDDKHVRLGFDHTSHRTLWSPAIAIDYDAPHMVELHAGAFYPPAEHPFFDGRTALEVTSLTRYVRATFNGAVVIESTQPFYDASPESIKIGGVNYTRAYGEKFTGEILSVRRGEVKWMQEQLGMYGAVSMRVLFPRLRERSQPLVQTGGTGNANTLYVRYMEEGVVRFGYDHWGHASVESGDIRVDLDHAQQLFIRMPSMLPPESGPVYSSMRSNLLVLLNDRVVWTTPVQFHPAPPNTIVFAANLAGASVCEPEFSGLVAAFSRHNESQAPLNRHTGKFALKLVFPTGKTGLREPLIVRGVTGRADVLLVEYIDENHVRFGLDHWGVGMFTSDRVACDYSAMHNLQVEFVTNGENGFTGVRVEMDGNAVWSQSAQLYQAAPEEIFVGLNRIGASTCSETFSGAIVDLAFPDQKQ